MSMFVVASIITGFWTLLLALKMFVNVYQWVGGAERFYEQGLREDADTWEMINTHQKSK